MAYCKLKALNFTKQSGHIHLLVGLIPCSFYNLAVVPFELMAHQNSNPFEERIFDVLVKSKVLLFDCVAVFVLVEYALCDHELVSVQIEGGNEDSEKAAKD